jgi:sulfotransferase 6B1
VNEQPAEHLAQQIFGTKWVANGFPKSGTHLLAQMLHPLAPFEGPTEAGYFEQPWVGTFTGNSWTLEPQRLERTAFALGRVGNGKLIKAHLGYSPELANFVFLLGMAHVFIYRDLRDVAVSQAHHILRSTEDAGLAHPNPTAYTRDDFAQLLLEVLVGHAGFPGLVQRWTAFAGWINDPWTLAVRYEDLVADPKTWAGRIFSRAMRQAGLRFEAEIGLDPYGTDVVTTVMAENAQRRERSPSFRRGQPGAWREDFQPPHIAAFRESGGAEWLVTLGYEEGLTW